MFFSKDFLYISIYHILPVQLLNWSIAIAHVFRLSIRHFTQSSYYVLIHPILTHSFILILTHSFILFWHTFSSYFKTPIRHSHSSYFYTLIHHILTHSFNPIWTHSLLLFRKCESVYPVTSWLPCPPLLNIPDCTSPALSYAVRRPPFVAVLWIGCLPAPCQLNSVVDPDPDPDPGEQNDPQKLKKVNKFLKCWLFAFEGWRLASLIAWTSFMEA